MNLPCFSVYGSRHICKGITTNHHRQTVQSIQIKQVRQIGTSVTPLGPRRHAFVSHVCSCCFSNMSKMLFPALRPLESRLRDACAGTPCALSSPCFLPMLHNLLRPGDFYCVRCPLNFDAGNLCRKQPGPGGLGLQKPNRRHKETAYLSLADCIIACLARCVEERPRHEVPRSGITIITYAF